MNINGIVLLPTLNRPQLLERFLDSFYKTTDERVNVLVLDGPGSMGEKCRKAYPKTSGYKWVGLLNDDHVCITKDWDKIIDGMIDGTNMVSTNDGFWNFGTNVVGLTAWSAELLKASGIPIFPHSIDHWFIDNIWKAIGEKTGCWVDTMKVNIEHRHVFRGQMEMDETAKISQNQEKANHAAQMFQKFMDEEFNGVCERIQALRESKTFKNKFV